METGESTAHSQAPVLVMRSRTANRAEATAEAMR